MKQTTVMPRLQLNKQAIAAMVSLIKSTHSHTMVNRLRPKVVSSKIFKDKNLINNLWGLMRTRSHF